MGPRSNGSAVHCASAYQQCGGAGWTGPACCQADCKCSGNGGGSYLQCTPPLGSDTCSTPSSGPVPNNATAPAATTTSSPQPSIPWFLNPFGLLTAFFPAPTPAPKPALPQPPSPAPLPVLQPTAAAAAATIAPPPLPTVAPVASLPSAGMQCASLYGQCGGRNWVGAKCCSGQAVCKATDEYYGQCVPSIASDASVVMRKDAQVADLSSSVRPSMSRWPLTWLPVAGGVFLATLMLLVLAAHRRPRGRQSNQGSHEERSFMLPPSVDSVP